MTRKYTESEIRDIIADNLQCIEPGMVLIQMPDPMMTVDPIFF